MEEQRLKEIRDKLQDLFTQSRLVFWYDRSGDFAEEVKELVPEGVSVWQLTDRNAFRTKLKLEKEDPKGKYLVYAPFAKPDVKVNHLEDTLLYSKEFYADSLSYFMAEAHMPGHLRPVLEQLKSFLFGPQGRSNKKQRKEAERRREDFLHRSQAFDWLTEKEDLLWLLALCTLVQARNTTVDDLFYGLFAKDDATLEQNLAQIREFNLTEHLWNICRDRFGYQEAEPSIQGFLQCLFVVTTFRNHLDKIPAAWKQYAQESARQRVNNCNVLLDNMMNNVEYQKRYDELSRQTAQRLQAAQVVKTMPLELFLDSTSFACIDESIIQWINERLVGVDANAELEGLTLEEVCRKRLRLHFGRQFQAAYQMLISGTHLLSVTDYQAPVTLKEIANTYSKTDYQIDTWYRHFFTAYDALEAEIPGQFDTLRTMVQNFYRNQYLEPLLWNWNEAFSADYQQEVVPRQTAFYQDEVAPVKEKVAVIISDAFRLEAAKELAARFREDPNCSNITEKVRMAPLPSITPISMAALLPHTTLAVSSDPSLKVTVDGKPCSTTIQREKILQARNRDSAAIDYDTLVAMKAKELREFSAGKEVIYIYHNRIDATGEALKTENSVFQAVDNTLRELFQLVKRLSRTGNIYRFLITADHGFLYTRQKLSESDKLEGVQTGTVLQKDRRFFITEQPVEQEGVYSLPWGKLLGNQDSRYIVLSKSMSVFKCAGGSNYVHGGSSPQELLVPCLFISTKRGLVDTEDAGLQLISTLRKVASFTVELQFYQEKAISDRVKPATYRIRFETGSGEVISNEVLFRADSREPNLKTTLQFDLQKKHYDRYEHYFIKAYDEQTGEETISQEVQLDLPDMVG